MRVVWWSKVSRTFKLLVEPATAGDTECTDKLFEVDRPVLVLVEYIKYIICKLCRIAKGEELFVYPRELCLVKRARRAILAESLVPGEL
jgi:hypothetical protein